MEETPLNPVKKRIAEVIKPRGLKARLAEMLGFERASISDMLKSPGDPPTHYVKAVSELTGRTVQWLLTGEGPESEETVRVLSEPASEYIRELERLRAENESLRKENEILRSALREIGRGSSPPDRYVGQ